MRAGTRMRLETGQKSQKSVSPLANGQRTASLGIVDCFRIDFRTGYA